MMVPFPGTENEGTEMSLWEREQDLWSFRYGKYVSSSGLNQSWTET